MRIVILCCVLLVLGAVFVLTDSWRLLKTVYLIVRVSPFERYVEGAPTILVLGDSTGYGTGATRGVDSIAGQIGRDFPDYSIQNRSRNGSTVADALRAIQTLPDVMTYDLILLQLGGNDILQKRATDIVRLELAQLFEEALLRGTSVVMISTGNVGAASVFAGSQADTYTQLTRTFSSLFEEVAASAGVTYVDLFIEPEIDVFVRHPSTYLSLDGLHPSSAGYAVWYALLMPTLQRILVSKES